MRELLLVGSGGFVGAILRYGAARGLAGAVAGAAIADALDENMVAGAALGGLAGAATCGIELGLPPCRPRY